MARRHGQKMGCCELVAVVFGLFVALQFVVLGTRVIGELAVLTTTLVKWVGVAAAGVVGIALLGALVYGLSHSAGTALRGLLGGAARTEGVSDPGVSLYRRACRWRRGIGITIGRLRRRGWISREDAKRYRETVTAAVARIRSLEADLATLRSLPASVELADELDAAARTLLARLEQTHQALAKLLAESALQRAPLVDAKLRDATDEVEALVAALADVNAAAADEASGGERRIEEALTNQTR